MATLINISKDAKYSEGEVTWEPKSYRCHLAIVREDDGRVSVIVLNLPGVGSCGDTEDEAIANAREAIRATLETYIEDKEEIPWVDSNSASVPDGAKLKWILVNV